MNKRAFTMLEIILTVIILSSLMGLTLPRLWGTIKKSKASEAAGSFSNVVRELEHCMQANGVFYDCGNICSIPELNRCLTPILADSAFNNPGSNFTICNGPAVLSSNGVGFGIEACLVGGDPLDLIQFFYGSPDIAGGHVGWGGRTIASGGHGIVATGYGAFEGFTMAPN